MPTVHPVLPLLAKYVSRVANFEATLKSYGALDVCAVPGYREGRRSIASVDGRSRESCRWSIGLTLTPRSTC